MPQVEKIDELATKSKLYTECKTALLTKAEVLETLKAEVASLKRDVEVKTDDVIEMAGKLSQSAELVEAGSSSCFMLLFHWVFSFLLFFVCFFVLLFFAWNLGMISCIYLRIVVLNHSLS